MRERRGSRRSLGRRAGRGAEPLLALNRSQAQAVEAIAERIFPTDDLGPGAREAGVLYYIDRALAGAYRDRTDTYALGLRALDEAARSRCGKEFAACGLEEQDSLLEALEAGTIEGWQGPGQRGFFELLWTHVREGMFGDPAYGGNRDMVGWRLIGFPGAQAGYSAAAQQGKRTPRRLLSMADRGFAL